MPSGCASRALTTWALMDRSLKDRPLSDFIAKAHYVSPFQTIDELLQDPERREQLGQLGKQRIDQTFCWNVCAREMTDYYRQVLANENG